MHNVLRSPMLTSNTIYRTTVFLVISIFALWLRWRCYLLLINIFANHAFHQKHHESYRIFTNLKVTNRGHTANTPGIVLFFCTIRCCARVLILIMHLALRFPRFSCICTILKSSCGAVSGTWRRYRLSTEPIVS